MRRTILSLALVAGLGLAVGPVFADDPADVTPEQVEKLKQELKELEGRLMKVERKSALDRVNFTGDYRFEAHSIDGAIPDHFNGMQLQRALVDTLFYFNANGMPPASPADVPNFIRENYADYLFFSNNLTCDALQQAIGSFPPEMRNQLLGSLVPYTFQQGYDYSNSILYTNRLRLQIDAKVADNVNFHGPALDVQDLGRLDRRAGLQRPADLDQRRRHHRRRAQLGHPARRARLLHLEGHRRRADLPLDRPPALDRRRAAQLPPGRAARRHAAGLDHQLPVRRHHRRLAPQRELHLPPLLRRRLRVRLRQRRPARAARRTGSRTPASSASTGTSTTPTTMFIQTTVARAFDVTDGFNGLVVLPGRPGHRPGRRRRRW